MKLADLTNQKDWTNGDEDNVSFDLLFEIDGVTVTFELKVTQSTSGWTGATHATSKSPNYILISIEIEKNKVVVNDEKYVKGIFIMVVSFANPNWKGVASEDSSFTKFSLNSCTYFLLSNNTFLYKDFFILLVFNIFSFLSSIKNIE